MTGILHVVIARKPIEGTVADNCLEFGCGALNIDACRIAMAKEDREAYEEKRRSFDTTKTNRGKTITMNVSPVLSAEIRIAASKDGRWPANLILDVSAPELFPEVHGAGSKMDKKDWGTKKTEGWGNIGIGKCGKRFGYTGSASRFFFNFTEQESDE